MKNPKSIYRLFNEKGAICIEGDFFFFVEKKYHGTNNPMETPNSSGFTIIVYRKGDGVTTHGRIPMKEFPAFKEKCSCLLKKYYEYQFGEEKGFSKQFSVGENYPNPRKLKNGLTYGSTTVVSVSTAGVSITVKSFYAPYADYKFRMTESIGVDEIKIDISADELADMIDTMDRWFKISLTKAAPTLIRAANQ